MQGVFAGQNHLFWASNETSTAVGKDPNYRGSAIGVLGNSSLFINYLLTLAIVLPLSLLNFMAKGEWYKALGR
ncbi:hypothetical protein AXFE_07180 [Acidithrix ferrooxidans]|uniref:Uncharacterized protein n=1 Tax=Acidithrix ferrooxidans TaxID=1280514 RepID=A0A0D8HK64_9ACTN|nr:hypothetical protein AXFE_07180 [Acidithrix ferrooxidans]